MAVGVAKNLSQTLYPKYLAGLGCFAIDFYVFVYKYYYARYDIGQCFELV